MVIVEYKSYEKVKRFIKMISILVMIKATPLESTLRFTTPFESVAYVMELSFSPERISLSKIKFELSAEI